MKRLTENLPVFLMILLATILTAVFHADGKELFASALLGSTFAVLSVWFTFFSIYRFTMFVTRGAPFKVGDFVRVTVGDDAGKVGEVTKLVKGSSAVFLNLEEEGGDRDPQYFDWNQVTRRGVTKTGRISCG